MPNQEKVEIVQELKDKITRAKGVFFADYKGLNVEQINALRSELYKQEIEFKVVKKTLTKIAAKEAGYENLEELIDGQMGLAFSYSNPVLPAKVIKEFKKKNKIENFEITGCIFEGETFTREKVASIANLPSRDELMSTLLATLNAPMSNLLGVLNAGMSQFAGVLKSLSDRKN